MTIAEVQEDIEAWCADCNRWIRILVLALILHVAVVSGTWLNWKMFRLRAQI